MPVIYLKDIDDDLHASIKIAAAQARHSMREECLLRLARPLAADDYFESGPDGLDGKLVERTLEQQLTHDVINHGMPAEVERIQTTPFPAGWVRASDLPAKHALNCRCYSCKKPKGQK